MMSPEADGRVLREILERTGRRARNLALLRGAAIGLLAALPLAPLAGATLHGAALALAGALAGVLVASLRHRSAPVPAVVLERGVPSSRNLIFTGSELLVRPDAVPAGVGAVVVREAARLAGGADPRRLLPAVPSVAALVGSLAAWALVLAVLGANPAVLPAVTPDPALPEGLGGIEVTVAAPAYTGLEPVTLIDPAEIRAIPGSRIALRVESGSEGVLLETLDGEFELEGRGDGVFTGEKEVEDEGFLSIRTIGADDARAPGSRLIGLSILPDERPVVEITEPGADLYVPDGDRTIELRIEASDDFGLAAVRLHFTRVSGFGEFFTFDEGELPLQITRRDGRRWEARAQWDLSRLELEEGDIVVYRAEADDHRPGAPPGESETYTLEVSAGRAGVSGGFAGEDEMTRYAISQQMVIVMTEQLMARRDSISEEEFVRQAHTVAAAQRRVRAEFVFMIGGELEDEHDHDHFDDHGLAQLHEEAHARADADAAEGRLAHQGRLDLTRSIQAMSHAQQLLTTLQIEQALQAEQTALLFLQRAFSARRYILRAFTEREELDPTRRLTGELGSAIQDTRPRMEAEPDSALVELRRVLAAAAALASAPGDAGAAARADALSREVLRTDPASPVLRDLSAQLSRASEALAAGRTPEGRATLETVFAGLTTLVRESLRPAPPAVQPFEVDRVEGALADALRQAVGRGGGSP